jgi:predicted AlkP superfamily pyrophosphatase or phosphodiesterase
MKRARVMSTLPLVLAATLAAAPGGDPERPRGVVTDHVLVVSIDGLRPDAIAAFHLETLGRLMREGSYSLEAQTILPSKTLPSHTSMLTGLTPEDHGVLWNRESDEHGAVGVPTIFELARRHGFHTAAFFSKAKFRHLQGEDALYHWEGPSSNLDNWMATRTVPNAIQYMEHRRPNLLFVHIGEPDYAGHTTGWMSMFYGWATRRADAAVERLLEAADATYGRGKYTVIVTSDHGGHGRDHGSDAPEDVTIPWIAWGQGVSAIGALPPGVRTMDTAATALWLLGVEIPPTFAGRAVTTAFLPVASPVLGATGS